MRVIAGKAKGTRLVGLKKVDLRPTLDRVKESLFNQIGQRLDGEVFLDLFAGTGNIGIEALSRGAEKVVFVENDCRAWDLICRNLEKCHFGLEKDPAGEKNWVLLKCDALRAVPLLRKRGYLFDLVYVDPPFAEGLYEPCLTALAASDLLTGTSRVVVEHHHKNILRKNYDTLVLASQRRLGDTCLSIYRYRVSEGCPPLP